MVTLPVWAFILCLAGAVVLGVIIEVLLKLFDLLNIWTVARDIADDRYEGD